LRGAAAPPRLAPAGDGPLRFQGCRATRFHAGRAGFPTRNPAGGSIAGGSAHIWYGNGWGGRINCSFMVLFGAS
jgi:hypothetical protein